MDDLPEPLKSQFEMKLANPANTYMELSEWLKEEGYPISKSAVGRYAVRTREAAQRVAETLQRTQAIAQAVEAHPDLDYTKAAELVLMDGLMQRVSTAEEEFDELLRRRFLSDIDTTVLDGIFHQVDAFLGELHHRIFAVGIIGTDRHQKLDRVLNLISVGRKEG